VTTDPLHVCRESLSNTGYGFGHLDYYCMLCERLIRRVPLEKLTPQERQRVAKYGVIVTGER
jgi:hypothetical protein